MFQFFFIPAVAQMKQKQKDSAPWGTRLLLAAGGVQVLCMEIRGSSYLSTSSAENIVLSNWNKEACSLQGSVKLLWSWFLNHLQLLTSEEELMTCFPLLNHCDVWIDDALLRGKTFSNILWVSEITVTGLIWSHRCALCCLVAPIACGFSLVLLCA